jgi:hypothetical protein
VTSDTTIRETDRPPAGGPAAIAVENITKKYGDFTAVDGV